MRRPSSKIQTNTFANYFQPLQLCLPRKRLGQEQNRTSSKVNTSLTEEAGNMDQEYEHRVNKRTNSENDRIP